MRNSGPRNGNFLLLWDSALLFSSETQPQQEHRLFVDGFERSDFVVTDLGRDTPRAHGNFDPGSKCDAVVEVVGQGETAKKRPAFGIGPHRTQMGPGLEQDWVLRDG